MGQVKISKLVLEISGKKIELTMKQAKELKDVLNDTFGESEMVFRDRWYPYPNYPNYGYPNYPWNPPFYTTCGTGNDVSPNSLTSDNLTTVSGSFAVSGSTTAITSQENQAMIDDGRITLTMN